MATLVQTVGQLVSEKPSRAAVFERVGIDFHNAARLTLEDACRNRGLDMSQVLAQLELADASADTIKDDCAVFSLTALCDHVVAKHHSYLRGEMPRLGTLLFRVAEDDGEKHPELRHLLEVYGHFTGDLKRHIDVEEEILFPMIRQLEAGEAAPGGSPGRIEMLVDDLANEHETARAHVDEIRMLTRDYAVPGDACDSYKRVLTLLAEFERDLREHLGIENNILFPKACQMEQLHLAQ